jgi:carbamoyl-phosphate synthase large subunit
MRRVTLGRVLLRIALVVVLTAWLYTTFELPMRRFEASTAAAILRVFDARDSQVQLGTSVAVFPVHHSAFRASVTPSCSALPSVLALSAVVALLPVKPWFRRGWALAVALAVIVVGNICRVVAVMGLGLVAGSGALVLFHDWVGSTFTFAYTFGGFLVFLYLMLPRVPADAAVSETSR